MPEHPEHAYEFSMECSACRASERGLEEWRKLRRIASDLIADIERLPHKIAFEYGAPGALRPAIRAVTDVLFNPVLRNIFREPENVGGKR